MPIEGGYAVVPEWLADVASANAVKLFVFLARYANIDGDAWPYRSTLACRMRVSRDTIDRALKELVSVGAITIEQRRDDAGDLSSNLYHLGARVRPGGRTVATTPTGGGGDGLRADAATGYRADAANNESQENESQEELAASLTGLVNRESHEAVDLARELISSHGENVVRDALKRLPRRRVNYTSELRGLLERTIKHVLSERPTCTRCVGAGVVMLDENDPGQGAIRCPECSVKAAS